MKILQAALLILCTTLIKSIKLENNLNRCATENETIEDFFPDKLVPKYAKTFNITYHGTYKILTNLEAKEKYLLYQCGTDPPQDVIDSGEFRVVTSIPLPDGIALTSTVQIRKFVFILYYVYLWC